MRRRGVVGAAAAVALVLGGWPHAGFAGGRVYDPYATPELVEGGLDGRYERSLAAGISLRIPLGGQASNTLRDTRLAFGLRLHTIGGGDFASRPVFPEDRPLLELSLEPAAGPDSLALNTVELARLHRLYAQDPGEEDKGANEEDGVNWWWVAGGIAGAALLTGIVGAAIVGDDVVPDFEFEEQQMTGQ